MTTSAKAPSLLILEDESNVGSTLLELFTREGFKVQWAKSIEEAKLELSVTIPDLALLDVGLPDGSGFDIAKEIRKTKPGTALVFLTAFGNPEHRVKGLELGAEDYIVKPFHWNELRLRVRNALSRARSLSNDGSGSSPQIVEIGKAQVDFSKFEAKVAKEIQSLTHKECALLRLLVKRRGEVVSRDEILDSVWGEGEDPSPRTIDNFILRLRKLVEINPEEPEAIQSVRGVGYILK